jgi:intracellular sulfur oxidation DsrE/DsrF family protein
MLFYLIILIKGKHMKKMICILILSMSILYAQEDSAKVVYDLTTKELANFELRILKAIVANKAHYESTLRELDVAVVIHGGAYRFFTKDPEHSEYKDDKALVSTYKTLAKRIETMANTYDVEFLICGVGLRKHGLKEKDIYDFVKIIKNSTIGLIDKQSEGYAYVPISD